MLDGEYQFPCGCWATYGGPHWGYGMEPHEHTCNGAWLKTEEHKQQRAQKRESAIASNLRGSAPLYREPFSILKPTNKNRR